MVVPVKILTLFATKLKCLGVKRKKLISTLDVLDSASCKSKLNIVRGSSNIEYTSKESNKIRSLPVIKQFIRM